MDMAASAGVPALQQDSTQMAGFLNSLKTLIEQAQVSLVVAQTGPAGTESHVSDAGNGSSTEVQAQDAHNARQDEVKTSAEELRRRKLAEIQKEEEEEEREKLAEEHEKMKLQEEKDKKEREKRTMKRFADYVSRLRPHIARNASVKLQRVVRGFVARKLVRRLAERRDKLAQRGRVEKKKDDVSDEDRELMEVYADQVRSMCMCIYICLSLYACLLVCVSVCVCVCQSINYYTHTKKR